MTRVVHRADALAWLAENPAPDRASVITSIPHATEARGPGLGDDTPNPTPDLQAWRAWCIATTRSILRWLPPRGVAVFYQSDFRAGATWIDKSYLTLRAVEEEGAHLAFHKIVCRKPPGTPSLGRSTYSHMIAASMTPLDPPRHPLPDVLPDAGFMPFSKAMGVRACELACTYLARETETRVVVDPFCGEGTALAVANALGFDAIGVDLSPRRCRGARKLQVTLSPTPLDSPPAR